MAQENGIDEAIQDGEEQQKPQAAGGAQEQQEAAADPSQESDHGQQEPGGSAGPEDDRSQHRKEELHGQHGAEEDSGRHDFSLLRKAFAEDEFWKTVMKFCRILSAENQHDGSRGLAVIMSSSPEARGMKEKIEAKLDGMPEAAGLQRSFSETDDDLDFCAEQAIRGAAEGLRVGNLMPRSPESEKSRDGADDAQAEKQDSDPERDFEYGSGMPVIEDYKAAAGADAPKPIEPSFELDLDAGEMVLHGRIDSVLVMKALAAAKESGKPVSGIRLAKDAWAIANDAFSDVDRECGYERDAGNVLKEGQAGTSVKISRLSIDSPDLCLITNREDRTPLSDRNSLLLRNLRNLESFSTSSYHLPPHLLAGNSTVVFADLGSNLLDIPQGFNANGALRMVAGGASVGTIGANAFAQSIYPEDTEYTTHSLKEYCPGACNAKARIRKGKLKDRNVPQSGFHLSECCKGDDRKSAEWILKYMKDRMSVSEHKLKDSVDEAERKLKEAVPGSKDYGMLSERASSLRTELEDMRSRKEAELDMARESLDCSSHRPELYIASMNLGTMNAGAGAFLNQQLNLGPSGTAEAASQDLLRRWMEIGAEVSNIGDAFGIGGAAASEKDRKALKAAIGKAERLPDSLRIELGRTGDRESLLNRLDSLVNERQELVCQADSFHGKGWLLYAAACQNAKAYSRFPESDGGKPESEAVAEICEGLKSSGIDLSPGMTEAKSMEDLEKLLGDRMRRCHGNILVVQGNTETGSHAYARSGIDGVVSAKDAGLPESRWTRRPTKADILEIRLKKMREDGEPADRIAAVDKLYQEACSDPVNPVFGDYAFAANGKPGKASFMVRMKKLGPKRWPTGVLAFNRGLVIDGMEGEIGDLALAGSSAKEIKIDRSAKVCNFVCAGLEGRAVSLYGLAVNIVKDILMLGTLGLYLSIAFPASKIKQLIHYMKSHPEESRRTRLVLDEKHRIAYQAGEDGEVRYWTPGLADQEFRPASREQKSLEDLRREADDGAGTETPRNGNATFGIKSGKGRTELKGHGRIGRHSTNRSAGRSAEDRTAHSGKEKPERSGGRDGR